MFFPNTNGTQTLPFKLVWASDQTRLPCEFVANQFSGSQDISYTKQTRRPAFADRTAYHQFQATGQPLSRTQASDAMTSRLPRYEAKCVQRRCFQCGSVPLRSDIKGMELPTANILIPLERQLTALQLCRWHFLYNADFFALDKLNIRPISTSGLVDLLT